MIKLRFDVEEFGVEFVDATKLPLLYIVVVVESRVITKLFQLDEFKVTDVDKALKNIPPYKTPTLFPGAPDTPL